MIEPSGRDVAAIIREGTAIDEAIEAARRRVVRRHQQLGIPLIIWDGVRVVEVPPETAASEEQPRDGENG
jgi:hypothetical protein